MDFLRAASLIAATITMGVVAGVFQLYAYTIMPALRRVDDRTFVGAFQALDRAIINPLFMASFLGALVFSVLAALFHLGESAVLSWVLVAVVLYAITVVITIAVNVPLNDALKAAGDPDSIDDLAGVRSRFSEDRWARFNVVRAVASTISVGCLAWALVEFGRST